MNQNKLLTSLAAFSSAALILLVIVGFSLRSASSPAVQEELQPIPNSVEEQVQLLEQTINAMATREVLYQQQLLEANQLIVNSSNPPATEGLAQQQQVEALQQAVATMQARELQYQQQIEAANLLLQQPASQMAVVPPSADATSFEEHEDEEGEEYEEEEHDDEDDDDHSGHGRDGDDDDDEEHDDD
jgi:hypothetical protein